jgi:hypothetical protein
METVRNISGRKSKLIHSKPTETFKIGTENNCQPATVQQRLYRWYHLIANVTYHPDVCSTLFPESSHLQILQNFEEDLKLIPELLLEEMTNNNTTIDKGQYIRLVQALLVNISDELFNHPENTEQSNLEIEKALVFIQNFFCQSFDKNYRLPMYLLNKEQTHIGLKLEYWKIRFGENRLFNTLKECISEKVIPNDHILTFQQKEYTSILLGKIELMNTLITEEALRELLIFFNFNSQLFVEFEIEKMSNTVQGFTTIEDGLSFLQEQLATVAKFKTKAGYFFEPHIPSVKQQLAAWISQEIKNYEIIKNNIGGNEFVIELESKIQTSFSVAKLAVLIRLLVADKIIINKSVAPMLRTVARLFTTLQKDEISFGSLETKYHAPDKNTINIIKEMLQKWVALTGKL